jgi:hypothetical protein
LYLPPLFEVFIKHIRDRWPMHRRNVLPAILGSIA